MMLTIKTKKLFHRSKKLLRWFLAEKPANMMIVSRLHGAQEQLPIPHAVILMPCVGL